MELIENVNIFNNLYAGPNLYDFLQWNTKRDVRDGTINMLTLSV